MTVIKESMSSLTGVHGSSHFFPCSDLAASHCVCEEQAAFGSLNRSTLSSASRLSTASRSAKKPGLLSMIPVCDMVASMRTPGGELRGLIILAVFICESTWRLVEGRRVHTQHTHPGG